MKKGRLIILTILVLFLAGWLFLGETLLINASAQQHYPNPDNCIEGPGRGKKECYNVGPKKNCDCNRKCQNGVPVVDCKCLNACHEDKCKCKTQCQS